MVRPLSLNCKNVQHVKINLPYNFEVNPITHFGVIAHFSSGFRGEDLLKSLQTDDGRQVMAIAYLTLWVR
jgi:hypothetical protein